jgi:hypothetical protein
MGFIVLFASYGSTQLGVSLKLTLPLSRSARFYSTNTGWSRDQSFDKTSQNFLEVSRNYLEILWKFQWDSVQVNRSRDQVNYKKGRSRDQVNYEKGGDKRSRDQRRMVERHVVAILGVNLYCKSAWWLA